MKILIKGGRVIDPASGTDQTADVAVAAGHVLSIGPVPADYAGSLTDYAALKAAGVPLLGYGAFITVIVNFLILAFIIFMMVRTANRIIAKPADAPAGPSPQVVLLTEIRDELKRKG